MLARYQPPGHQPLCCDVLELSFAGLRRRWSEWRMMIHAMTSLPNLLSHHSQSGKGPPFRVSKNTPYTMNIAAMRPSTEITRICPNVALQPLSGQSSAGRAARSTGAQVEIIDCLAVKHLADERAQRDVWHEHGAAAGRAARLCPPVVRVTNPLSSFIEDALRTARLIEELDQALLDER